jgi:NAD(P)H-hydrate epimerase
VRKLKGGRIEEKNIPEIEKLLKKHGVVVMGMGTGDSEFSNVAAEILKTGKIRKAVLDAEGITKDVPEEVECILTPHRGEFRRVFGKDPDQENVKKMAEKIGATILLKAKEDIISDGDKIRINKTGNAGMTVGGTGDVLSGVVGALFASADALWSASAAAFINGLAGDLCFQEMGYNFTAMNVASKVPIVIKNSIEFGKT